MAASSLSISPISTTTAPVDLKDIPNVVTSTAIATVQAIVGDNQDRMTGYRSDLKKLDKGIFYGNEYMKALQVTGQSKRLAFFRNKGSFFHGYTSPKHFELPRSATSPTDFSGNYFVIKPGVRPSEALQAMREGISFIGCGETCLIGLFEGIKASWGTEKFDTLFARETGTPLIVRLDCLENPIYSLLTKSLAPSTVVKGRIYHFMNAQPDYPLKHLNGEHTGCTTLCIDDTPGKERFATLNLTPEGKTREQISAILLNELNETPIGMEIVTDAVARRIFASAHPFAQQFTDSLKDKQYTLEEFQSKQGGLIQAEFGLDMKVITLIASQPIDKALALFQRLNVERTQFLKEQGII